MLAVISEEKGYSYKLGRIIIRRELGDRELVDLIVLVKAVKGLEVLFYNNIKDFRLTVTFRVERRRYV